MNRFYGRIGFVKTEELSPGKFGEKVEERKYYGEFLSSGYDRDYNQAIIPNINLNNRISLLTDQYAFENAEYIAYIVIAKTKWAVRGILFEGRRCICTLKGIYQGGDT